MRALFVSLLFASGCYLTRSASIPMPAVHHSATSSTAKGLIVFLPGFGDGPDHYRDYGFVELVKKANPGFDVIAADAHFAYYRNFTVVDRLHEDLIGPVKDRYQSVWLVGISMGGFGAAAYTMTHRDFVDGVILLAPYMGDSDVIDEVKEAGGLSAWSPPDLASIEDKEERKYYELWTFYKGYAEQPDRSPQVFIGYGDEDRLGGPNELVAEVLPDDHKLVRPGGHKWKVWTPLFEKLVVRAIGE